MASTHTDKLAVRQSVEVPVDRPGEHISKNARMMTIEMPSESGVNMAFEDLVEAGEPPTLDNCDENHNNEFDPIITISSTSKMAGQTVAPFLAKHIPDQYAPLPKVQPATTSQKDPNTKYCYRHRPDSKCRRTADEPTMENLQRVCLQNSWVVQD
jgi:F-box and WD-40 domain protein MET30